MLSHLPSGRRIFIDSNIFIYHFLGLKDSCTQFLVRAEKGEIIGLTSVIVISEVWHRLMIAEAIEIYSLAPRKAIIYLRNHPDCVKQLSRARKAISCIPEMKITIWNLTKDIFALAQSINQEYGLLTNDSLNLALMHKHHIRDIATNDTDFKRIGNIKVWRPN